MNQPPDSTEGENRQSSTGLYVFLTVVALAGVALMFRIGMGALDMSGAAMEHNKLLSQKTKVCSDRSRLKECADLMERIEKFEKQMKRP